jgi:hypothetical protein
MKTTKKKSNRFTFVTVAFTNRKAAMAYFRKVKLELPLYNKCIQTCQRLEVR